MKNILRYLTTTVVLCALFVINQSATAAQKPVAKIYVLSFFDATDVYQREYFCNDARMVDEALLMRSGYVELSRTPRYVNVPRRQSYVSKRYVKNDPLEWTGGSLYENSALDNPHSSLKDHKYVRFSSRYNVFEAALKALSVCPATSNDTLVVFWSGHGEFIGNEHYLTASNGTKISRKKVLQAMKSTGARLVVLLTDCCASEYDPSNNVALNLGEFDVASATAETTPLFDELFLRYRGVVDVNSSSRGQKAFSFPRRLSGSQVAAGSHEGNMGGGCFTLALADEHTWEKMKFREQELPKLVLQDAKQEFGSIGFKGSLRQSSIGRLLNDDFRVSWKVFFESVQVRTQFLYEHSPSYSPSQPRQTLKIWELPTKINDGYFEYQ